jgi:hypothetical protein
LKVILKVILNVNCTTDNKKKPTPGTVLVFSVQANSGFLKKKHGQPPTGNNGMNETEIQFAFSVTNVALATSLSALWNATALSPPPPGPS